MKEYDRVELIVDKEREINYEFKREREEDFWWNFEAS